MGRNSQQLLNNFQDGFYLPKNREVVGTKLERASGKALVPPRSCPLLLCDERVNHQTTGAGEHPGVSRPPGAVQACLPTLRKLCVMHACV